MELVYDLTVGPRIFKLGDSQGQIEIVVSSGLPAAIATATAVFSLWRIGAGARAVTGEAATISSIVDDADTGTKGATLSYSIADGDLDEAGYFLAEFVVTFADLSTLRIPPDNSLVVRVVQDIGSLTFA